MKLEVDTKMVLSYIAEKQHGPPDPTFFLDHHTFVGRFTMPDTGGGHGDKTREYRLQVHIIHFLSGSRFP